MRAGRLVWAFIWAAGGFTGILVENCGVGMGTDGGCSGGGADGVAGADGAGGGSAGSNGGDVELVAPWPLSI